MEAMAGDWLQEAGTVPPGNGVEAHIWQVMRVIGGCGATVLTNMYVWWWCHPSALLHV
jgi:hypothetical protein